MPALPPSAPVPAPAPQPYAAQANPYVPQPAYGAPAPPGNPYAAPAPQPWNAPPPVATNQPYGEQVPPSVTPQAQATPSSLGFQSPQPDFSGFSPIPPIQETPAPQPAPVPASAPASDPALFTMNKLSGQEGLVSENANAASGSLADQAYAKLASMDTFTLESKKDAPAANPFASSSSISDNRSLADMQKSKVRCASIVYGGDLS